MAVKDLLESLYLAIRVIDHNEQTTCTIVFYSVASQETEILMFDIVTKLWNIYTVIHIRMRARCKTG